MPGPLACLCIIAVPCACETLCITVMNPQVTKGAQAVLGARPYIAVQQWQTCSKTVKDGRRHRLGRTQRHGNSCVIACQAAESVTADTSSTDRAGDELETFETHVGMVEPVDEDDAEVCFFCSVPMLSLMQTGVLCKHP